MIQKHHQIAFLILFIMVVGGITVASCTVMEVGIEHTPTPNLQLTAVSGTLAAGNAALATRIAEAAGDFSNSISSSSLPSPITPSPTSPPPSFSSVRFAPQPDDTLIRYFYVEGTPRIFALWDYSGMREGMLVKRVWKLNDEVWIEREEVWPFTRYGRDGTVRDIYIFDDEIGVEAGKYSLSLFIDGVLQDLDTQVGMQGEAVFFVIESDVNVPVTSNDKSHTAFVEFGGKLMMEEPDGRVWEMAEVQEVSSITWFPDNTHLLYTERDRTRQSNIDDDTGTTHRMFIIDIETGEQTILGTSGENFHHPVISPGGELISILSGSTSRDNCTGSPILGFIELDGELRRQAVHTLTAFSGLEIPGNNSAAVVPNISKGEGAWESATRFSIYLEWVCKPSGNNPDGVYSLDLSQQTAVPKNQP